MMYWVVIVLRILHMFNSILLRNKKCWDDGGDGGREEERGDGRIGCEGWTDFAFFIRN